MSGCLSDKAMLARLNVSQWAGRKCDKQVTAKVNHDYAASSDAGRYNKSLVAKDALDAIQKAANEARTFHYARTLPWRDDGARILPAAGFSEYSAEMRKLRGRFDQAVREFVSNYDSYVSNARIMLNGMFRAEDYPSAAEVASRFAFAVSVDPMPDAGDFRVSLQAADVASIQADIERRNADAYQAATRDLWSRLYAVVSAVVDRLSHPDAIFRDSLLENVSELVGLLPVLNVTGDTDLTTMANEVKAKLAGWAPDTLRASKTTRAKVAADAKDILDKMAAYCGQ